MTPDQLRSIADPIERARAARTAQAEKQAELDAIAAVVREAVREARQLPMSHAKIAAALGVTPGRVQQLEDKPKVKAKMAASTPVPVET